MRPRGTTSARVLVDEVTEGDVADVCAIAAAAFPEGPAVAGAMSEASLREELARPWARVWAARDTERRVLGFLLVWHVVDEIHVLNVAVLPDHRRRGVGRVLVDFAVSYGVAHRVKHLLLEVRRSNRPAIALYRALGFYALGLRRAYYSDGEDAVEMVLAFDESGRVARRSDEVRLD